MSANSFQRVDAQHPLNLYRGEDEKGQFSFLLISSQHIGKSRTYKGFEITVSRRYDLKYVLKFTLTSARYRKLFDKLCEDLIETTRLVTPNQPKAVWDQFLRWLNLFKEDEIGQLSDEEIRGLIGELLLMRDTVIPKYTASLAIRGWTGPTGARHDFSLDDKNFEAKTVLPNAKSIKISSPEQMEPQIGKELTLAVVRIEQISDPSIDGAFTLPQLVELIRNIVIADDQISQLLDQKLSLIGYSDINIADYENIYFVKRAITNYPVTVDFPKIRLQDIPSALSNVSWDLRLDAIERFRET